MGDYITEADWVVVTPDLDVFVEALCVDNSCDIEHMRWGPLCTP